MNDPEEIINSIFTEMMNSVNIMNESDSIDDRLICSETIKNLSQAVAAMIKSLNAMSELSDDAALFDDDN
ncbi:MAG: hypothetical protein HQL49_05430 [Gammaproteobacteria bacterium]|nr:hypothetical protein [Gammaproteobacteria bacterium]